jgi:outer membrane lipase/esterase
MSFKFLAQLALRRVVLAAALAGSGLLASCGGGTLVEPFKPTRILAFGDELSTIEADGRKYTINGTTPADPAVIDCTLNPLWIQTVAASFGLVFDRCLGSATVASGQVLAQAGHKVANFAGQIAAVQGAAPSHADLALVMLGMNDILELYAQYPTVPADQLLAQARARGAALGQQISQFANGGDGPAVVVLTVPDLGLTPFALAQNPSPDDTTRSALLTELTKVFNDQTSIALTNDGRQIGLAYADIEIQNMVKFPGTFLVDAAGTPADVVTPACQATAVLPGCTAATLVSGASTATWLWADALRLGPTAQTRLGILAARRALDNPF